jgi:hypothetical protein
VDDVRDVLPQTSDVSDPQLPEKSSRRPCDGPDDNVIVSVDEAATNLNHTSPLFVAPQPAVKVDGLNVELTVVPPVFTQLVAEVRVTAFAQSSFAGCANAIDDIKANTPVAKALNGGQKDFMNLVFRIMDDQQNKCIHVGKSSAVIPLYYKGFYY